MALLCHPCITTANLSYRFPIFETSATALCGSNWYILCQSLNHCFSKNVDKLVVHDVFVTSVHVMPSHVCRKDCEHCKTENSTAVVVFGELTHVQFHWFQHHLGPKQNQTCKNNSTGPEPKTRRNLMGVCQHPIHQGRPHRGNPNHMVSQLQMFVA